MKKMNNFKKLTALLSFIMLFSWANTSWGQTIFTESMGNSGGTVTITAHESANGFDNDTYTMSNLGCTNPADIRISSASSGYTGSTGLSNVYFTATSGEYGFSIDGINTTGYNTLLLTFAVRKEGASGTAFATLNVEYSTDGTNWNVVTVTGYPATSAGAGWYLISNIAVPSGADNQSNLRLRWRKTGTIACRVDDIMLTGTSGSCSDPTTQTSAITFSSVATTTMTVGWTRGGTPGDGVIAVAKSGSVADDPSDLTTYTANAAFTSGTQIGATGTYVVYMNSGTSVNVTALTAGTMYYFKSYEKNCTGTSIMINTSSPANGNCATKPNAVTVASFTATGTTTADISWTKATGHVDGNHTTMVFVKATSAVTAGTPDNDDAFYTANPAFSSGTAYEADAAAYCVYKGDGTSVSITGLSASTTYHVYILNVVDASNSNSTNSYSAGTTASGTTIKPEPTNYPTAFACGTTTSTTIPLTWTGAVAGSQAPDGYLIKWSSTSYAAISDPVDGTAEANGATTQNITYGTNAYTAGSGTALTPSTTYYFKIWSYTNSGTNINYKTVSEPQTSCATSAAPTVFISEIAGYGMVSGTWNNEYIELSNTGSSAQNLDGWQLIYYEAGAVEETITFSSSYSIAANDAFVIAARATNTISEDYLASFSINSNYNYVILKDNFGTVIDQAGYQNNSTNGFTTDVNYEFTDCGGDNLPIANWDNLGTTDGTPGVVNCACSEPTTQATTFTSGSITATGMTVGWTRGNGTAGVIVVARAGSAVNADPVNGTDYTANAAFSSGDEIGTGNYVVYKGTGTSIAVTGLLSGTTYHYAIYEYNTVSICYNKTQLTGSATTICADPTTQTSAITFSTVATTTMTVGWTRGGTPGDGVIAVAKSGSVADDPSDLTTYTANAAFTSGTQIGATGTYVVYMNNGTSVNVTALTAGTMYYFKSYEKNCTGTLIMINTSSPANGNCATKPNAATSASFTATGTTAATISWTKATGHVDGNHTTMVFVKATSAVTAGTPDNDDAFYTANTVFSNGTAYEADAAAYCVYKGDGTSVAITGLSASTTYHVYILNVVDASNSNSTNSYSAGATASGTTQCNNVTLNYSQGFENSGSIPTCWSDATVTDGDADATLTYVTTSTYPTLNTADEGSYFVKFNSYTCDNNDEKRLITPPITTTAITGISVKFAWYQSDGYSTYTSEGVTVQWSTDAITWNNLTFYQRYNATNGWSDKTCNLPAGAENQPTIYVAFLFHSQFGSNCYLDDVVIETTKPEPSNYPTAFACGTTTSTTIPLTWTGAVAGTQAPDGYLIKWSSTSYAAISDPVDGTAEANGATTQNITFGTNAYTAGSGTALTPSTTYYFKIWSYTNSGSNINYKTASEPQTSCATTASPCGPKTVPYTQNFDAVDCWTITGIWEIGTLTGDADAPSTGHSGNTVAGTDLDADYVNSIDIYLTSPVIDLAGTTSPAMSFWMDIDTEAEWDGGTVQIKVNSGSWITIAMTDPGYGGTVPNDTDVDGLQDGEDGWEGNIPSTGEWTLVTINIFDLTTTGLDAISASDDIQVRFWFGSDGSNIDNGWYIDDFTITDNSCASPSAVTSSSVTGTTATISWTAASPAPANGYDYEIRTSGDAGSGATGLTTSGTNGPGDVNVDITGLTANTVYYVYVRSYCAASSYSEWTTVYSFSTLKPEPTNYPTAFTCGTTTSTTIPLTWTTAVAGTQAPDGYLIKWSSTSYAAIPDPVDGTAQADGATTQNVSYGTTNYTAGSGTALSQNTTYYFKIWSYTNSGTSINYKTVGEPQTSCSTITGPCLSESAFTATPAGWAQTSITYASGEAVFGATTGQLATISVSYPTSLTFDLRRTTNTSAKTMYVEISTTTQGGTYTIVDTYDHGNTTSGGTTACTVDLSAYSGDATVFIRFRKASSTTSPWYLDNVSVSCSSTCTAPSTQASAVSFSDILSGQMTVSWTNGNGSNRIVLMNTSNSFTNPTDGTDPTADNSWNNAGEQVVYNGNINSVSITGLSASTTYWFRVYEYNCAGTSTKFITTTATNNPNSFAMPSTSSDIVAVTSSESATVSSIENTAGPLTSVQGVQTWQFTIRDGGSGLNDADALPTIVNSITLSQSATNAIDVWTDILSADLFDGTTFLATATITANQLQFSGSPVISVADNQSKTLTLRISLKATKLDALNLDGEDFGFQITNTNATVATSGSSVFSAFTAINSADAQNVLSIVATELKYVQQPSDVNTNINMTPAVTVEATDVNGNRDLGFTETIKITATGSLMSPTSATSAAVSGLATFSALQFSVTDIDVTLNAERNATSDWDEVSTPFDVTNDPIAIVYWNFPSDPDDNIADGGIVANTAKTLTTVGGTNAPTYAAAGATTNSALASGWDSGSGTKYWQVEFVTTSYGTLKLSSKQKGSNTSPRDFKVQYKIGAGGTWTDVTGATVTVADNWLAASGILTDISLPVACENQASVYLRWIMTSNTSVAGLTVASTGNSYIDDIIVTGYPVCTPPATQASGFATNTIGTTSMNISFTRGNGNAVMVVCRQGSAPTDPGYASSYIANSVYGSGDACGGGYVVYNGIAAGPSVATGNITITGLSGGMTYYYAIYEYYSPNCYNMTELTGSATTTVAGEPTNHAGAFTCGSTGPYTIPLTWTDATGAIIPDGYLIKWSTGAITPPVDGTAEADGAGVLNVAKGVQSAIATGLNPSTSYNFKIWSYTNSGININYKIDASVPQTSCTTQQGPCLSENFDGTFPPATWTNGGTIQKNLIDGACDGDDYVLGFNAQGDFIVTPPMDNPETITFQYKVTSTTPAWSIKVQARIGILSPWIDVQSVSGAITTCQTATVDVSDYIAENDVYFKLVDTRTTGTEERYIDDFNVFCSSCIVPTKVASNITFTSITGTAMTLNWTSGDGTSRIIIAKAGSDVTFIPDNLTTYAANSAFGSGTDLGNGQYCVYNGSGSTFNLTGLSPNIVYYFAIYEYNCTAGHELYYETPALASQGTANYISTGAISGSPFCVSSTSGTSVTVPFTYATAADFTNGVTVFTAQLSDENGSFVSPVAIGTVTSNASGNQSISATLPANSTTGTGYTIRVISTNPNITGSHSQTLFTISNSPENVMLNASNDGSTQSTVSWNAPAMGCYNDYLTVVSLASITGVPTGNGSLYTANPAWAAGTAFGGGYVVYEGTGTSVTITGLTNGTPYYVRTFTHWINGTEHAWSSGSEMIIYPNSTTEFGLGDLAIVAICTDTNLPTEEDDDDEISFVIFKTLLTGTSIELTDNGYERLTAGLWADSEGVIKMARTSGGNLPAGTIITITGKNITWHVFVNGINDDANWTLTYPGTVFDLNIWDQVWFMQGGTWVDPAGLHNATYDGNILYGWTATGWKTAPGYNSTQGSTIPAGIECNYTNVQDKSYPDRVKYSGIVTPANKIEWIGRLNDSPNWLDYSSYSAYDATAPLYKNTDIDFPILSGLLDVAGRWAGYSSSAWCDCANWKSLTVPLPTTNVIIPETSTHYLRLSAHADSLAVCNNITIYGPIYAEGDAAKSITVNSKLTIATTGLLDFDDENNATADGTIYVKGNWKNDGSFLEGNSSVIFTGAGQTISTSNISEDFYNFTISSNAGSASTDDDVKILGTFTQTAGNFNLFGSDLTLSGIYSRSSGNFIGNSTSNLTINGSGTLDDIYFTTTQILNDFSMDRPSANANLMSHLTTTTMDVSAGSITFNPTFNYTIGTLTNTKGTSDGLVIKSDATGTASLLQTTGPVPATVERYLTGGNWHTVFSPLSAIDKTDYPGTVYSFNETIQDFWNNLTTFGSTGVQLVNTGWTVPGATLGTGFGYFYTGTTSTTAILSSGTGVLLDADKAFTVTYSNHDTDPNPLINTPAIPTSGTSPAPNPASYTGCIDDWTQYDGWNMIGNPYASAINWDNVPADDDIERGIYIWDPAAAKYKYYMNGGTAFTSIAVNADGSADANIKYIPSGQGFFVKAKTTATGTDNFTIPKSARTHTTHTFWKEEETQISNLLRMNIEKDGYTDETVLCTFAGSTDNHDGDFDLYKRFSMNSTKPQIYTTNAAGTNLFALNTFPEIGLSKQIPVSIYIGAAGEHTINFTENTYENVNIYLEDTELATMTNVRASSSYTFTETAGLNSSRFILHFNLNNAPAASAIEDVVIYQGESFEVDYSNVFSDSDLLDELTINVEQISGKQLPEWISNLNSVISGTATNSEVGFYTIRLTANDLCGATAETSFNVTVLNINDAPYVSENPENKTAIEDQSFEFALASSTFVDIDANEELQISSKLADGNALPSWLIFDNSTLTFTGSPSNSEVGLYHIILTANDLSGATAETKFILEVVNVNDAPELIIPIADIYAEVGTEFFADLDDYTFVDIDANDVLKYTALLPSWINFNSFSLTFYGTPEYEGTTEIKLTASDLAGESANDIFNIIVSPATSVIDADDFKVSIYPNPSNGIFVINCNTDKSFEVKVTDITGKAIYHSTLNTNNSSIDLSRYAAGVYYIELTIENQSYKEKLIKL